jgi:nitrite reductase/ring-hydroxylating ferredoxin subunit
MTEQFHPVAKFEDVKEPHPLAVSVGELSVALCKVGEKIYAIENLCSHDDGVLIDDEHECIEGHEIKCPRHGARFDVRDGSVLSMPAAFPIRSFEVKVEDNTIYVKVDSDE